METDDADFDSPREMTPEVLARVLDALRNPRVMRYLVASSLSKSLYDLVRADGTPIDNYVIGMITALRPLLTATVNEFSQLPAAEHKRRATLLAKEQKEEGAWLAKNHPEYDPDSTEIAVEALEAALPKLNLAEQKNLAIDLINRPDAMIHDAAALVAFERVLKLTRIVERWSRDENEAYCAAMCNQDNILPILRDLRRTLN
jgi:hypothetical protein